MKKHPVVYIGSNKKREDMIKNLTKVQEKSMDSFLRKVKAKTGDIAICVDDRLPGSIGIMLKWRLGYVVYFDKKGKMTAHQFTS